MFCAGHWSNWLVTAHMVTSGAPVSLKLTLTPHCALTMVTQEGKHGPLAPFLPPSVSPESLLTVIRPGTGSRQRPGRAVGKASFLGLGPSS